ncbi:Metallo-dependent phosphatase-like protein [Halteromyces radiatus]|uniref:Metallo-dependent phosphatase-like protein n=1 Tax=Halteromyces radiatus TaxID=101107 RepID=UPI002220325B|nr:Metallo-dependent phosphatase-like protein [Halteromyces radiatus]KAI8089850.1 Metallo-dependent phosphatase-like protein [Halteromyces radiatus]
MTLYRSSYTFYMMMIMISIYIWYMIILPFELQTLHTIATFSWQWWGRPSEPPPRRFGYFLHITDMHIDESYLPGATVDSDCHRLPSPSQRSSSSSITLSGKLGTPGEHCDSPIELAQQTLNWLKKEWKHKLDFVVWTGDNARHDWDKKHKRKRKHIYKLNEKIQDMMVETFWPTPDDPRHIPLVPSIGNNDVHPHNYIGGDDDHGILSFYSQLWHNWIPQDQQATFQAGGYFAVDVGRHLRIISLNTMYFYSKNDAVRGCHKPGLAHKHMEWFEQQLVKARSESVKVYVMGHVPPSPRDYRRSCFEDYTRISAAFPDVLKGHFYGHLNMDHFLLFDGRETQMMSSSTNISSSFLDRLTEYESDDDDDLPVVDNGDDQDICINRNINAYVDWLRDMYSSIDPPEQGEQAPVFTPLVAIQVSPSVLPVYLPSFRIYRYEINDNDNDHVIHSGQMMNNNEEENGSAQPHGTLLGYQQYYANITKWEEDNHNNRMPLEYQLEYDTYEAYGLTDLTVESYYQLAKDMVDDDDEPESKHLWSKYIQNMFVQTLNEDLEPSI